MAERGTLHDALIAEMRDAYDAENQLVKALPKMAKAAKADALRDAFEGHLEETRRHH
jgi:ferritin-like metal-binding protein YciE